jgi:type VI secretion system protein ImpA
MQRPLGLRSFFIKPVSLPTFQFLLDPISEALPCGIDLDNESSNASEAAKIYHRVMGQSELIFSRLSASASEEREQAQKLLPSFLGDLQTLCENTRDVRVVLFYAKLLLVSRKFAECAALLSAFADGLEIFWEAFHPHDLPYRLAILETLNDFSGIVRPLQTMPLVQTARHGAISYRHYLQATGRAPVQGGESTPNEATVQEAFAQADIEQIAESYRVFQKTYNALKRIAHTVQERLGEALLLGQVQPRIEEIRYFLAPLWLARDPDAALDVEDAGDKSTDSTDAASDEASPNAVAKTGTPTRFKNHSEIRRALQAALSYYHRHEPASPVVLIVQQALNLVGKSFRETLETLLPEHAEKALFYVGTQKVFKLQVTRFAGDAFVEEEKPAEAPSPSLNFATRQETLTAFMDIIAFYRAHEPASAIPLLLEHARTMANQDFLSLVQSAVPSALSDRPTNSQ